MADRSRSRSEHARSVANRTSGEERETKAAVARQTDPDRRREGRCDESQRPSGPNIPTKNREVRHEAEPSGLILRKEVIQPQVPLRLPCYDFTPVADPTVVACLLAVGAAPSGKTNSHGVTGGVYKARERIHRAVLLRDY